MIGGVSVSAVLLGAAPACTHEKMGPEIDHAPLPPPPLMPSSSSSSTGDQAKRALCNVGQGKKDQSRAPYAHALPRGAAAKRTIGEGGEAPAASQGPIFDVVRSSGDWGTSFGPAGWRE